MVLSQDFKVSASLLGSVLLTLGSAASANAQSSRVGPYDGHLSSGGAELFYDAPADAPMLFGGAWTISAWVSPDYVDHGQKLLAGVGGTGNSRDLALINGHPAVIAGHDIVTAPVTLRATDWHFLSAVEGGGILRLYVDGREVAHGNHASVAVAAGVTLGGHDITQAGFAGDVIGFTAEARALSPEALQAAAKTKPDRDLIQLPQGAEHWPVQVRQMYGQTKPQPPSTLPTSRTPASKPAAVPAPVVPAIVATAPGRWQVNGWQLAEAPDVTADGAAIARTGFTGGKWLAATVPGTVLTTLVDRGVYPDPSYGLNNLAIPYKLAHQDYWYRTEFDLPPHADGRNLDLVLNGVNYAAEIWVNGIRVGDMKGAFIRGRFDVSALLKSGRNAVAVRVSPPPHPGLAHEESLTAGVGENGGMMMLDGPTFGAAEGWDWIPTLRDRNTGMWQGVTLEAADAARLGDADIVTTLPKADNTVADIHITVPVTNKGATVITTSVTASFDDVRATKQITVAPGTTAQLVFAPSEFPQLAVRDPKLWWPNGYGAPDLHMLHLFAAVGGRVSDAQDTRFGMREVSYDISLMDKGGELRRVRIDPARAHLAGQRLVDQSHTGIRKVPGGWAYTLRAGMENSAAVTPVSGEDGLTPYLVICVNGVRIAARGGNIGMDDFMKRVSRDRLEPYFKLHRDAHLNIVRNWVGQNTEENFYDLADEYGLMILNDFWESTQDYNAEAQDVPLFLQNARDVVQHFRNHPSIVAWFGRNEGVPQPILNDRLADMLSNEDGTRLYMPSSNRINLHDSGPYNWRPEEEYFTEDAKGFAVELGTPSFPTIEAWKRAIPQTELWPISDSWAYHDWHQTGNGAVSSFMDAMNTRFGKATGFTDFARKAQMLAYDSYRAIFEGFNAGLWKTNSGRMLWMTQPAWPSSAWQIFSHDYDTHGAFYGVKKASEPVHVQMNLPDHKVILVNNGRNTLAPVAVTAKVMSLDNRVLATRTAMIGAAANSIADAFTLDLDELMTGQPVFVQIEAKANKGLGDTLSTNFYWEAAEPAQLKALDALPQVPVTVTARARAQGSDIVATLRLLNGGSAAAIETKLTFFNDDGTQILPAYFSDNYVSLLPGEVRTITVTYPASAAHGVTSVALRGWNVLPAKVVVEAP